MTKWMAGPVAAMAMAMLSGLALGCTEDVAGDDTGGSGGPGGSGGSGGAAPCAEECNAPACPENLPPYPSFACSETGLACSYTFGGCVIDFACSGDEGSSVWNATSPSECEIPVACSLEGVSEGAACATKAEHCDIACSYCVMECGDDNRWHEKCPPPQGDCG